MKKEKTYQLSGKNLLLFEDYNKNLNRILTAVKENIKLGGGKSSIEKYHAKNKLTARERINLLIDKNESFFEINSLAAYNLYSDYGGAPSAGVVTGIGKIYNKDFMIIANDGTVKAGAWFPMTAKKNLRAQEIAIENKLPLVYLVDSAGVFLPLQEDIFPDKEHFGRIFRNNAVISAMGIMQIAAIMGPCVAGGAYLPIMSDEAIIVKNEGSVFLAGSHLVKAAVGEIIENKDLGGAEVQSNISGVTDYIAEDDTDCINIIRNIVSKAKDNSKMNFNRIASIQPKLSPSDIYKILPDDNTKQYDTYELLDTIIDDSDFEEYKAGYGKTLITGYCRIDGWAVGIVANQRKVIKSSQGEMQIGGVIYSDSADKAARFIMNCNQKKIPIVFFQDVTGFMVGSKAEHSGIIKDGAKLVNAVANSVVPKITIIVGNSFGAGNYALCGKAYDPRFIFAYPNVKIAVMGGNQAANVLLDIKIKQALAKGITLTDEEKKKQLNDIQISYEEKSTPYYAAARLWIDEIIDPALTRYYISKSIEVCNNNPDIGIFKTGVIQT